MSLKTACSCLISRGRGDNALCIHMQENCCMCKISPDSYACVCVCVRERERGREREGERERMSVCVMQAWLIVCSLVISSFVHACLRSLRPQFLVHTVAWLLRRRALHFIFMPLLERAYAQLGELHLLPNVPPSELLPSIEKYL